MRVMTVRWQRIPTSDLQARWTLLHPFGQVLEQIHEFSDRQTRILDNTAQGVSIDGIVSGYDELPMPVTHNNMAALANDDKARLFQCANGVKMIDARDLDHGITR